MSSRTGRVVADKDEIRPQYQDWHHRRLSLFNSSILRDSGPQYVSGPPSALSTTIVIDNAGSLNGLATPGAAMELGLFILPYNNASRVARALAPHSHTWAAHLSFARACSSCPARRSVGSLRFGAPA